MEIFCANLYRNLPGSQDWEGSFYERLVEYGVWDDAEFWKLHSDLIRIAQAIDGDTIEREIALAVMRLYIKISSLISAHFRPNDIYSIEDLSELQISARKERLDLAVIGVFSGEILGEERFDLRNPLL
jgi:hypothetical protein